MVFHWPPCPAVGLQPGFTLPPQLKSLTALLVEARCDTPRLVLVMLLNFAPPPVSQQPSFAQAGLEITKSCTASEAPTTGQKERWPDPGDTTLSFAPSSGAMS